jgi:hypothetical protein
MVRAERSFSLFTMIALLGLSACTQQAAAPPATQSESPFRVNASIQDIMVSLIDPSADYLWQSVATITTAAGVEDRMPRTDEEWSTARRHAVTVMEASNLLMMEGRRVAAPGKTLEASGDPGQPTAEQMEQMIAETRPSFIAYAQGLYDAASLAVMAIDAKDPMRLQQTGETIDQACELCHQTYWYPTAPLPPTRQP